MSAFVSNASGAWSATATWTQDGGAASRSPTTGDTVTIASGHDITLDVAATIGAGTGIALTIGNGVDSGAANSTPIATGRTRLTVAAPLTVKGHIFCGGVRTRYHYIELSAGQGIELDGNAGFQPLIYTDGTSYGSLTIIANGTSGSHCYIRSSTAKAADAGGRYKGRFTNLTGGTEDTGYPSWNLGVVGSYCDFTDLGVDLSVDPGGIGSFGVYMKNVWLQDPSLPHWRLDHARFLRSSCAFVAYSTSALSGTDGFGYTCHDWTFSATPLVKVSGTYQVGSLWLGAPYTGGSVCLDWDGVGLDRPAYIDQLRSITSSTFGGGWFGGSDAANRTAGSWSDVLAVCPDPAGTPSWSADQPLLFDRNSSHTYSRTYILNASTDSNQHVGSIEFRGIDDTINLVDWVLDGPLVTGLVDDYCSCLSLTSGATVNLKGAITLPALGGTRVGDVPTLCWFMGALGGHANIEHCTAFTRSAGGEAVIHCDYYTIPGQAGMLASVKSNLFVNAPGVGTGKVFETTSGTGSGMVPDAVAASNCAYNNLYNTIYNGNWTSGSPGANDTAVDPHFVDSTRNIVTWWRQATSTTAGTPAADLASAIAYLVANPASVPTMIDWVRAGFAPTNAALAGAAHDTAYGSTIGAVAYSAPSGAGRSPVTLAEANSGMRCPDLLGTDLLPAGNPWYAAGRLDISDPVAHPVSENNARWMQAVTDLHGGGVLESISGYNPGTNFFSTVPYMVVDRETTPYTHVPGNVNHADVPARDWMLPPEPISQEGNATGRYAVRGVDTWFDPMAGDYHLWVVVREGGVPVEWWCLYNLSVEKDTGGSITKVVVTSYRVYDLTDMTPPAMGTASTSAGGLYDLPLAFTQAELEAGVIRHALRLTIDSILCCGFNGWPCLTAAEGQLVGGIPLGQRARIRADRLDAVHALVGDGPAWVIAQCLATYGGIVDDYVGPGGDAHWWIQGSVDGRLPAGGLENLTQIVPARDMEFVDDPYFATVEGPTTLAVGESGTYTLTAAMPAGVDYGVSVRWYRTDDPSLNNPTDYGIVGGNGILPSAPTRTAASTFTTAGTYYPATNFQFAKYYVKPFTVTVTDGTTTPTATTYTLDLTASGVVNTPFTATVTPDAGYSGDITLTPSGGAAAGLSPIRLAWAGEAAAKAATFTPTVAGTLTVTATSSPALTDPSPKSATVTAPTATTYTLGLSGGGRVNQAVTATVTPDAAFTGDVILTPAGCGLSTPVTLTFAGAATPQATTFTPTSAGVLTVTGTHSGTLAGGDPAPATTIVFTSSSGAAYGGLGGPFDSED